MTIGNRHISTEELARMLGRPNCLLKSGCECARCQADRAPLDAMVRRIADEEAREARAAHGQFGVGA